MTPFQKRFVFIVGLIIAGSILFFLVRTGKNIEIGTPKAQDSMIQAVSGSNSALFNDTFNASSSENGVSVTESKVSDAEKSFEQRNLTDRISIDLFAKYLILKNNGQEITPDVQQALVKNVIEENIKNIDYTTFTGANLSLISAPTVDQIHSYGNALATLVIENSPKNLGDNELTLLAKMADGNATSEDTTKMQTIADAYTKIGPKIVRMTIPADAKPLQVALANAAGRIGVNISHFSVFETDPATAIAHISAYDKNVDALNAALKSLGQYFAKKGIVYSPKEPGYAFTLLGQ